MKNKLLIAVLAAFVLSLAFSGAVVAQDEPTTFTLSAYHFVKGDEIDLTREAPVFVQVIKDGVVLAYVPMVYKQRIETVLPAGTYELNFLDQETFDRLFTCGPYEIDGGTVVKLQAHEQGVGRAPTCYVKVFE